MTATLDRPAEKKLSVAQLEELACRAHLGVWAERKRGLENAPLHWEWSELAMRESRLCVVAPREHAKSEVFTVNQVAWRCMYTPGIQAYVFAQTGDQAAKLKTRIDEVLLAVAPWMVNSMRKMTNMESVYANLSQVTVAGAGKGVRGAHPDLVIGDDVLEEGNCLTKLQRDKVSRWWFGTVGGMAHPGAVRPVGGTKRRFPPTKVFLVGTPFHRMDLLMSMKDNALYRYRRYAAEFRPEQLVDGLAVEVS